MTTETSRPGAGLGRGLAALIPQREEQRQPTELPIAEIRRNPYQPRQLVDAKGLDELAASIAAHGVLQPLLVSRSSDGWLLIAGERRLRAAELAGLERVPVVVRSADEREQLALALVENLQRTDLNALEEAAAFRQLMTEFGLTQEEVAGRVGKSRPAVANTLRLLEVDPAVQAAVRDGHISEGHARAIAGLADGAAQRAVLQAVISRGLSVRKTEDRVRQIREGAARAKRAGPPISPDLERLQGGLRDALGTKVTLSRARRGGRITIEYYNDDDLGRLYERLTGTAAND
jgi:ParB family transcriptional regulator, chromosome partitioning protein